jgi:hypothetical protein
VSGEVEAKKGIYHHMYALLGWWEGMHCTRQLFLPAYCCCCCCL